MRLPSQQKQQKNTPHHNGLLISGAICLAIMFGVQIFLAARVATSGDQIKSYENEKRVLVEEINALNKELAHTSSMASVETQATERLGMVKSIHDIVYIVLPDGYELASNH